jgi:hypothetical protein
MQHTDLESAVNRPSWEWLADLAPRLDFVVEMLDVDGSPVFPAGSSQDAAAFRMRLEAGEPVIRTAVSDVCGSKKRVFFSVESFQALCCGLTNGSVLLLARNLTGAESIADCRQDLESIGNWLTGAVEATLTQTSAISVEPYRIISFRRILREATSRGSIRKVIGAFIEALSVWDDVRVRCYIAGANGGLVEYGAPLESLPSSRNEPDESIVPQHGRMVRLSRPDVDRLGLVAEPGDTIMYRMLVGDIPWLLVFSGMIDDREQVRLRLYSDILRESLSNVVMVTTSRLVAEVSRARRATNESPESEAQIVLGQLTNALGSQHGALALTTASGKQALTAGDTDLLSLETMSRDQMMVKSSDAGSVLTVAFEREQVPFTAFEREIAVASVTVVHRWMQAALQRSNEIERRQRARAVDAVFDQLASDAIATGRQASVIVVSVDEARLRPGLLPGWVGRIRAQLRAGDYAGMLSEREIAVLLCGASAEHAAAVSARLAKMLRSDDASGAFLHSAIGMTTRAPGSPSQGSIVGAARAKASARH